MNKKKKKTTPSKFGAKTKFFKLFFAPKNDQE